MANLQEILDNLTGVPGKVNANDFTKALKNSGLQIGSARYSGGYHGDDKQSRKESLERELARNQNELAENSSIFRNINRDFKESRRYIENIKDDLIDAQKEAGKYADEVSEIQKRIKDAQDTFNSFDEASRNDILALQEGLEGVDNVQEALNKRIDTYCTFTNTSRDEVEKLLDANEKLKGIETDKADLLDAQIKSLTAQNRVTEKQNTLVEKQNRMREQGWAKLKQSFNGALGIVKDFADQWAKIDAAASKFSKTVGASAAGMNSLRKASIDAVARGSFGAKYNLSADELIGLQGNFVGSIGRNVTITNEDLENMAAMNAVMGEQGGEMAARFENFGLSYTEAAEKAGEMFQTAGKYGLSFQKYSDNFVKNLSLAQNYTFANGLKGLENMAKKATAIKLDMSQIASFAEKVSSLQGAVETGAQLQVLGGSFSRFADPLGMLNEGLLDMEGLMDRFTNMVGGLGRFDKNTGEINVSSFNKQRIKAAAQALGMDYGQVMESVQAQAKQRYIGQQIVGKGYTDEEAAFIRNTASVKGGKPLISWIDESTGQVREKDVSKERLTSTELGMIKKQNQTDSENIKDIAQQLRSWDDVFGGTRKQLENKKAQVSEHFMPQIKDSLAKLGENDGLLGAVVATKASVDAIKNLMIAIEGGKMLLGAGAGRGIGKAVNSKAAKKIAGTINKGLNKTRGGRALTGATSKVARKVLKKTGSKTLARLAGGLMKGGGIAGMAGLVGVAGDILTDKAIASGKMKKGGAGNWAARIASGAASGAGIGAIGGGIGAGIGAAIGALAGAYQATGDSKIAKLEDKYGLKISGSYGAVRAKKIQSALETGEISDRLRKKLESNGDIELLNKIDEIKQQNVGKITQNAQSVYITAGSIQSGSQMAKGGLITGPSHANGGVPVGNTGIEVEGGEFVVNKKATSNNLGLLKAINKAGNGGYIAPRKLENGGVVVLDKTVGNTNVTNTTTESKISFEPIKLDITGRITLDGGTLGGIDITDELIGNKPFIRKLTKMIEEQIIQNVKGGNVVQKGFYNL